MATVPNIRTWTDEQLTAAKMQEISDMLSFLKFNSGGICHVRATATQSLLTTSDVPITFSLPGVEVNTDGMWNASTPTRFTAHTAGWYVVSGVVTFQASATGSRFGKYKKNGTTTLRAASLGALAGGVEAFLDMGLRIVFLAVNDYLELTAWQNTGGFLSTSIADGASQISVVRIAS